MQGGTLTITNPGVGGPLLLDEVMHRLTARSAAVFEREGVKDG